jgi:XTP/dITP diphosphohydrolase
MQIVLATSNPHKIEELDAIFRDLGLRSIELLSLSQAAGGRPLTEPAETGTTFEANATIKALSYASQLNAVCLADDSGIEIDALSGRPGVISSHYCTDGREEGMTRAQRDAANNARVMRELAGVKAVERSARFVCVMALAFPGEASPRALVRGTFEGRIGLETQVPRGENGFGYDPLFLVPPEFEITAAELPADRKNTLSHRAAAARKLATALESMR